MEDKVRIKNLKSLLAFFEKFGRVLGKKIPNFPNARQYYLFQLKHKKYLCSAVSSIKLSYNDI